MTHDDPQLIETPSPELSRAIDNVLVASHTLKASLAADHLPFSASLAEGVERYGAGPVFALWQACRAVDALRLVWTGKRES